MAAVKKLVQILSIFCLVAFIPVSCNKDDKDDSDSDSNDESYLKIGNTEYELAGGVLEYFGEDDWYSGNNFDLTLYTDGLTVRRLSEDEIEDEGDMWKINGDGVAIYFEMFSSSETDLDEDDYVYEQTEPCSTGTFDLGYYGEVKDSEIDEEDVKEITDGEVTVSRDGRTYSIAINVRDETGKKITGFYEGTLRNYDYTDESSLKSTNVTVSRKFKINKSSR